MCPPTEGGANGRRQTKPGLRFARGLDRWRGPMRATLRENAIYPSKRCDARVRLPCPCASWPPGRRPQQHSASVNRPSPPAPVRSPRPQSRSKRTASEPREPWMQAPSPRRASHPHAGDRGDGPRGGGCRNGLAASGGAKRVMRPNPGHPEVSPGAPAPRACRPRVGSRRSGLRRRSWMTACSTPRKPSTSSPSAPRPFPSARRRSRRTAGSGKSASRFCPDAP